MTNTPELDANGNPITPGGGENVTLSKAEYDQLTQRLATLAQASESTVAELKEMREINAKLKAQVEKPEGVDAAADAAVQKALAAREVEQAKANYQTSISMFLSDHPEFSTENDADGTKFAAFQKAVERINLSGLKTVEDFVSALNDAYGLMERREPPQPANMSFSSSPRGGGHVPKGNPSAHLPPEEERFVKTHFGGDAEAYLKAKAKRPAYYEELLKWAR